MLGYIIRRILWIIPVLFFVSVITFTLMRATPSGPFDSFGGGRIAAPGVVAALNQRYGLNDPPPVQYLRWVGNLVRGDLGPSYKYRNRTVNDIVGDGIWITVHLGLMAFALSVLVGIPLGVIAALRHNGFPDYLATFVSIIGIATPSFVLSILLLVFFSVTLKWFPTYGWGDPAHWVLPTVVARRLPDRPDRALHASEHARGDAQGLRPHRAEQGPARALDRAPCTWCATRSSRS